MRLPRIAGMAAGLILTCLCLGCGDTFRPVATPITGGGGDPQAIRYAIVLNQSIANPETTAGSITRINVSGDSNSGNNPVGSDPTYLAYGGSVYTANKGDDTVTIFTGSSSTAVTLPDGTDPVYLLPVSSSSGTSVYVAGDNNTVVVIGALQVATKTISVGTKPVSMALSPSGKVYVVNQGSGTVTVLDAANQNVLATIPVGNTPVAAVANATGTAVYVLNQSSNTISVINPSNDTVTSTVTLPSGAAPTSMTLDSQLQRLYVANTGASSVSVFNATTLDLTELAHSPVALGAQPQAVAVLPDGTRAYVLTNSASGVCGTSSGQVKVINSTNNSVSTCVQVGDSPVGIAASAGGKVYVAHGGTTPGTTIIRVATNAISAEMPAPAGTTPIAVVTTQ